MIFDPKQMSWKPKGVSQVFYAILIWFEHLVFLLFCTEQIKTKLNGKIGVWRVCVCFFFKFNNNLNYFICTASNSGSGAAIALRFKRVDPESFLFCLERTVAMRCTPYNVIANRMNACMTSQFRCVFNTPPVDFIVDHFFADIIITTVCQLNFPLLTLYINERRCFTWFCFENGERKKRRRKMLLLVKRSICGRLQMRSVDKIVIEAIQTIENVWFISSSYIYYKEST